jgi:hypothetical protein
LRRPAGAEERDRPVATHPMRWEAGLERRVAWFLRPLDAYDPALPMTTQKAKDSVWHWQQHSRGWHHREAS